LASSHFSEVTAGRSLFRTERAAGLENNWIKTIPGQGWFAMFRLYGPLEPTFDGTWKLNNIESTN